MAGHDLYEHVEVGDDDGAVLIGYLGSWTFSRHVLN